METSRWSTISPSVPVSNRSPCTFHPFCLWSCSGLFFIHVRTSSRLPFLTPACPHPDLSFKLPEINLLKYKYEPAALLVEKNSHYCLCSIAYRLKFQCLMWYMIPFYHLTWPISTTLFPTLALHLRRECSPRASHTFLSSCFCTHCSLCT